MIDKMELFVVHLIDKIVVGSGKKIVKPGKIVVAFGKMIVESGTIGQSVVH